MEDYNKALKERIMALLKERDVSRNKLAMDSGMKQKTVNNQLSDGIIEKDKAKVSLEVVMALLNRFPDISADWLLRGVGPQSVLPLGSSMPSAGGGSINNNNNTTVNDTEAVRYIVRQLEEKDRQLEEKDKQIDRLMQLLERQKVG